DGAMERVSGWYKRWTQVWTVIVATVIVFGCNVDTIRIARELNHNAALRSAMAERAVKAAESPTLEKFKDDLNNLDFSLHLQPTDEPWTLDRVLGLLISVLAVSLGGPFWFDVLNRLVNLRQTGARPAAPHVKEAVAH